MNSIEEVRSTIILTFKGFHDALFPNVPANYPNYITVDAEHLTAPFVSVQLTFRNGTTIYDVSGLADIIRGELLVSYLYPAGTGMNGSMVYSDMLRNSMTNKKLSGITYLGMTILEVSPAPGIVGQMNVIAFMI